MSAAMVIAHLLGDFVFQWDALAKWKQRSLAGIFFHSLVVLLTTLTAAILVDKSWLIWAIFIGLAHLMIDVGHFYLRRQNSHFADYSALGRFIFDQSIHFIVILYFLSITGYFKPMVYLTQLQLFSASNLWVIVGYILVTLPAWILIEFLVYHITEKSAPQFDLPLEKYLGSAERVFMVTFVAMGFLPLAWVVIMPRLLIFSQSIAVNDARQRYAVRLILSILIAVVVGLVI